MEINQLHYRCCFGKLAKEMACKMKALALSTKSPSMNLDLDLVAGDSVNSFPPGSSTV